MESSRRGFCKRLTIGAAGISLGGIDSATRALGSDLSSSRIVDGLPSAQKARPNVVFVCSDEHNPKYAGYAGHPLVRTPNLDRIASQGVVFTDTYCGNPICVAARTSMMTGMYSSDCNSFCNATVWDGSHPTWGSLLGESGYYCRAVGKLDLNHKLDCGFDNGISHEHSRSPDVFCIFRRPPLRRPYHPNGRARDERHPDFKRLGQAMEFLKSEPSNLRQPWALYVGFTLPHPPSVALREYFEMYPTHRIDMPVIPLGHLDGLHPVMQELRRSRDWMLPIPEQDIRAARAGYYGLISEVDEYVGKIWSELERTNQLQNTVFIYTSDHGESLGEHGLWSKINPYDCATRVPLIIAGPGLPRGMKISTPVSHVDLVATLLDIAGTTIPSNLRGHSLLPLMTGSPGKSPEFAFSQCHNQGNITGSFVIRKGAWKYIHFSWYDGLLFNISEDPGEFNNLINNPDVKGIRDELKGILYSQIDPEEVTVRAFRTQEQRLHELVGSMTKEELVTYFEKRMDKSLARVMTSTLVYR